MLVARPTRTCCRRKGATTARRERRGGKRDFPLICECLLQRRTWIPLTYMVFDVLGVDGDGVASRSYSERRRILEELRVDGPSSRTPETFDDGESLWKAVCEHELEGVVAKPLRQPLRIGRARLDQDENRAYWALGARARGRAEGSARAAARLEEYAPRR
jgi:hypothetical protein